MGKKFADHVAFVPGAGEEAMVGHVVVNHGDTRLDIETRNGVERGIPRREPSGDPNEDLGRTWHDV